MSESDFGCSFEVPILDSAQAALGVQESWAHDALTGAEEPEIAIYGRREAEAMVFRFRGQWNRASEIITAAYFLFWFQLMWLATSSGLDWAVWAMFSAGLLFLSTLLAPWFCVIETRVTPSAVKVLRSSPWGKRSDTVELTDIASVEIAGDGLRTGLLDATDYYRVNLATRDGRKVRAAGHLRERRAAEIAASQIETAVSRALAPARPHRPAAVA
ncbi:MAG: hypothetical protein R2724_03190 [Bryobacterales bacterium]